MIETLQGSVQRIVFHSQETGFKVLKLRLPSGPIVSVTGEFGPDMIVGTVASFTGEYRNHSKYGTGFRAASYDIQHDAEAVSSLRLFIDAIAPNIGPERADMIVAYFGDELMDVLDNAPHRLLEVGGIGQMSADSLTKAWKENRERWSEVRQEFTLRAFLYALGIKERRVKKILGHYGGGILAEAQIRENPYSLAEVDGFGFSTADHVAAKLGVSEDSPERFRAFLMYCLGEVCRSNGHLFYNAEELANAAANYCAEHNTRFGGKTRPEPIDAATVADQLAADKKIIKDGDAYYGERPHFFESRSAKLLTDMMRKESDLILLNSASVNEHITQFESENGITLSEEQKTALHYFVEKKVFIITGAPGTGKCLGKDTPVLMFDGNLKKVQDIIPGDQLMGDDSTPRRVLSTCSGKGPLYTVTPVKGDSFVINDAHILTLKFNGKGLLKGQIKDIQVSDYLKIPQRCRWKAVRTGVNFQTSPVPLDPYYLGYWLGNGVSTSAGISTPYQEIVEEIKKIVTPYGLEIKKTKCKGWVEYHICKKTGRSGPKKNPVVDLLKKLNVLNNKHIPLIYKVNSRNIQMQILAGLIDSDGDYSDKDNTFSITFKSERLINDTCFLARSLGFSAYIKPVIKKWTSPNLGNKYVGEGLYFRINICGDGIEKIPTRVPKKKARKRKQVKDVLVTGITVTEKGVGDYYGFEIDGNGRFLLGDFTITHNTSISRALVELAQKMRLSLVCMTPTGISAKKLATTVRFEASTIHRKLLFRGSQWGFGEENKFEADVILVDESSMVDQEVFYRLLAALRDRSHLALVGDDNQLPSVGAGNVLRELINCGTVPVVRLETIFRQEEASDIIKVAHKIKNGDTDLSLFKPDPASDVFFLRENNVSVIEGVVIKLAQRFKDERRLFQILTPRNEGPLSVATLNKTLQEVLNPPSPLLEEMNFRDGILRRGDRIIVKKNDYENSIYNGDIGKIARMGGGRVTIEVDGREISLPVDDLDNKMRLAYAISVHASQGQEYPFIILPFINQYGRMLLQRNLLYTALTRAKKKVIVIGHGSALEKAINNSSVLRRNTKLGERVRACLPEQSIGTTPLPKKSSSQSRRKPLRKLLTQTLEEVLSLSTPAE